MGSSDVQMLENTMISPAMPIHKRTSLSLSTLDTFLLHQYTFSYILVYEGNNTLCQANRKVFTSKIKEALGQALTKYYPLAGRVKKGPNGYQIVFQAHNVGVPFVEVMSDQFTRLDFKKGPRFEGEWKPLLSCHVEDVFKGDPPVVVQLTWLADGSVVLTFGFSHILCDGFGAVQFIKYLAQLTCGVANFCDDPQPVWDRHLFDSCPSDPVPNVQNHLEFMSINDESRVFTRFCSTKLVPTSYDFTKCQINKLKTQARSTLKINPKPLFTSFEVISAHIWTCWAKALDIPSHQTVKLIFPVNFRDRIHPKPPVGYYGNAVVAASLQATVGELVEKGLGFVSNLIKKAKEKVDYKYVREAINLLSKNKEDPDMIGVLVLTSWLNIGLDKIDFGLGKPSCVGSTCSDICHILPISDHLGSVRVLHSVPSNIVDMYRYLLVHDLHGE